MDYTRIFFAAMLLVITSCVCTDEKEKVNKEYQLVKISTSKGEVIIVLYDSTPRHKASFISLVNEGYFNDYTFNRVIDDFVAQGGCPDTPEGFSDSPYLLDPEFNSELQHVYGAVGAGRDDNPGMLSAGCQFYIVQNKDGLHRLDNKYTVFGMVVKGMDVVDKIVKVATDTLDQPMELITLKMELVKLDSLGITNL